MAIPADHGLIRKLNTAILLDALRRYAPLSRAELAARSGLNRSTVSSIINNLIEEGFVQETDLQNAKVGRPGMLLVLNPKGGFVVGVELGVDYITVALTDFVAQVLWRECAPSDPQDDQIAILDRTLNMTQQALDFGQSLGMQPLGIGVGVPGLVDSSQGKLVFAPNLKWHNVPLRLIWSQRFHLPVFVENDANAAALGEYYFGAARGARNFIYLNAGIGMGGGILIDGKLFRGASGYAAEIGHMAIGPDGDLCGCGRRGCWETLVGPRAVLQRVRQELAEGLGSSMTAMVNGRLDEITFQIVINAARGGDVAALDALQGVGHNLGIGVANLVNIFNPELIVLGGELNLASQFLLPIIRQSVLDTALHPLREQVQIVSSAHGGDACVLGAVALVLEDILGEPDIKMQGLGYRA